jgi:hypothetical protein
MEILRNDSDSLQVKLTPDDIIPIGRHPHFGGLRNEVRDLFLGSLPDDDSKPYFVEKPVGVVISKEIDKPFCIPICCLNFLKREPGGFPTVVYTSCMIAELDVHQMLGVYCSYYLDNAEEIVSGQAIVTSPDLTVHEGSVDRLTASRLAIGGLNGTVRARCCLGRALWFRSI